VRGTHGRILEDAEAGPVFLCSDPRYAAPSIAATDVKDLMLRMLAEPRTP